MLRFTFERFPTVRDAFSIPEPQQWCGGVAPVKTLAIMWNARKICGRHIHTYRSFWYLPKPPIVASTWSKFISNLGKTSLESLHTSIELQWASVQWRSKLMLISEYMPEINFQSIKCFISWRKRTEINNKCLRSTCHCVVVIVVGLQQHLCILCLYLWVKKTLKQILIKKQRKRTIKSQRMSKWVDVHFKGAYISTHRDRSGLTVRFRAPLVTKAWNNEKGWSRRTTSSGMDRELLRGVQSLDQQSWRI